MASRGRGRRGHPRGTGQAPPAFDQQAFTEAVGIVVAAITQACAIVSQGRSNDLQRLEAHHPPMVIEGGINGIQCIQDMGAGTKRKEDLSSSNPRKKRKTSVSHGSQGNGQGYRDQDQDGTFSQVGQMMCYFYRQTGYFRLDCPQRQES